MHYGQTVSEGCGGHIHIGADYLTMEESWRNLTEIWGNAEVILYTISNKAGEIPRNRIGRYAQPISSGFEDILNSGTVDLQTEDDLKEFVKRAQVDRYYGINFYNVGENKNTIEFRLANGTINAGTWIENINLFGGIVRAAEDLAIIQSKPEEQRTEKDQKMLEYFEQVKNSEISQQEKLEALLAIVIPENDRDIYRKRYEINSQLIEQSPATKEEITSRVAKSSITVNKVGKKVFLGKDAVTGQEYHKGAQIIENTLQMDEPNKSLE